MLNCVSTAQKCSQNMVFDERVLFIATFYSDLGDIRAGLTGEIFILFINDGPVVPQDCSPICSIVKPVVEARSTAPGVQSSQVHVEGPASSEPHRAIKPAVYSQSAIACVDYIAAVGAQLLDACSHRLSATQWCALAQHLGTK